MPTISERSRNNIRAGVFVTIALLASLGVVVAVTGTIERVTRRTTDYVVSFNISSGVASLKKGSEVRVGGVPMGRVTDVEPNFTVDPLTKIDVNFEVDEKVKLCFGATIAVSAPLIGTDAALEISFIGDPTKPLAEGGKIDGTSADGMLSMILGADNADSADAFMDFLGGMEGKYKDDVQPIFTDAKYVMNDFREDHWVKWADSVDHVMEWAVTATKDLDDVFAEGEGLFADTRVIVNENRQPIKSSIANVESITSRVKDETVDKIHLVLDSGQEGLDQARAAVETFRVDYARWATDVDDTMANVALASQQLKLTMIEVRRSPWKIIYQPSPEELEHELLYEATRAFAVAAADLKATAESAQRILANHGDTIAADEALYRKLESSVRDSLARYEKAQQDMFDVLLEDRQP